MDNGLDASQISHISFSGIEHESTPIRNSRVISTEEAGTDVDEIENQDEIEVKIEAEAETETEISDDEETNEFRSIVETHPELNIAGKESHQLNPVNVAHVMFSPEKKNRQRDLQTVQSFENISRKPKGVQTEINREIPSVPSTTSTTTLAASVSKVFDPFTPYTLNLYLQLIVNCILWSIIIFLVYSAITTIRTDIQIKTEQFTLQILEEIAKCSREYIRNKCDSPHRPPAIDHECDLLNRCQNQDPSKFAKLKISVELIAEIVNAFFSKISFKSLVVLILILMITMVNTSLAVRDFQSVQVRKMENKVELIQRENKYKKEQELIEEDQETVFIEQELNL